MELAEQVDPEEWHKIMDRFFAILSDGVHRFEGRMDYTALGHTANLAARMEQIAELARTALGYFKYSISSVVVVLLMPGAPPRAPMPGPLMPGPLMPPISTFVSDFTIPTPLTSQ